MIWKCLILFLAALGIFVSFTTAVQCDFKYEVANNLPSSAKEKSSKQISSLNASSMDMNMDLDVPVKSRRFTVFDCEDPSDEFEEITGFTDNITSRVKPMGFDTRFGDDEYESAGNDCTSNKKTIQPKALNNIYNELMSVVNTATLVQSIEIDECSMKNSPCTNGSEPPVGKKILCRQKFVTITLKAYKGNQRKVVDEQFYYPSHCICELVQKKRST